LRMIRSGGSTPKLVDSTYIDNAADAHVLALDALRKGGAVHGKAYFISNGEPRPMAEILNRILASAGIPPVERSASPAVAHVAGAVLEAVHGILGLKGEPRLTRFVARQLSTSHWFDLTAARRDLGYEPRVRLDEGFARLAAWLGARSSPVGARS